VVESGAKWYNRGDGGDWPVFMGEYHHSVDEKGRLIIPAKFRDALGSRFVLTRGLDHCLFIYPMEEWAVMEQKLKSLPLMKSEARAFTRFFLSGATECELDRQGRVHIPPNLREYAQLESNAVIIGVSTRLEVWSREMWEAYTRNSEQSFNEIAEKLDDFRFDL